MMGDQIIPQTICFQRVRRHLASTMEVDLYFPLILSPQAQKSYLYLIKCHMDFQSFLYAAFEIM